MTRRATATHVVASALLLGACGVLTACGNEPTSPGTPLLSAPLGDEVPADARARLRQEVEGEPVRVAFPDNQGEVEVRVVRASTPEGGSFLLNIEVESAEAAGYTLTATLLGQPANAGTVDAPSHTRLVQVSRAKSGLTGSSSGQMTLRVTPEGVTRL